MKIDRIYRYNILQNKFFFFQEDNKGKLISIELSINNQQYIETATVRSLKSIDENHLLCITEENSLIVDINLNIVTTYNFNDIAFLKHKNILLYREKHYDKNEKELTSYFIKDEVSNNPVKLELKGFFPKFLFSDSYIIPYNTVNASRSILHCLNYEGKLVWERDLKEVGRFYQNFLNEGWQDGCIKDVQIFEELLIVSLYGYKVLALSIATGETVWEQKLHAESPYIMLDKSEGIVYVFGGNKYKINASTGEILFTKPESNWQEQPFLEWLTQPTVAADGIYAATHLNKPAKIIKYSKETLDVLNVIDLDNEAIIPTNYSPTITDKYLMQLDGEDSLHIFELKDL